MTAHDTNVWVYLYDARDPAKQQRARELVNEPEPFVLLWQVGCEFVHACRKLAPTGFGLEQAWVAQSKIRSAAASVLVPTAAVWDRARDLQTTRSLSFWDALIVAACLEGGVHTLYSEDLAPGEIDGLTIVNPFETE